MPLVIVAGFVLAGPVASQTNEQSPAALVRDSQLDVLFGKLKTKATNGVEQHQSLLIEDQIWRIWMETDTSQYSLMLAQASNAMTIKDYPTAERLLNELVAQNPRHAEVWNKRATLYYLLGRNDESLADIVKTLDLEPRHFGALSGRGMIYRRLGKQKEAAESFREALAINPHLLGARLALRELELAAPDL
jgi:tetratricopeptide (TPR) repeat protein